MNNSHVNTRSIGQYNGALQCITDKSPDSGCRLGEWYLPNRARVSRISWSWEFYSSGGDIYNVAVSLNRPHNVITPTGQFCCKVTDANYAIQTLCVTIGKQPTAQYIHGIHVCM